MKKFFIASATFVGSAVASVAGTLTEPAVEETVEMAEAATSSSSGILIPLLLLLAVGAAVASSDSEDEPSPT